MSCQILDKDQSFIVHDYGPSGYTGTADIVLEHGLKPGSVISMVTCTTEEMEFNLKDSAGNIILNISDRASSTSVKDVRLNSQIDGKWDIAQFIIPIPMTWGVRNVITLLYQVEGYRIFINGKDVAFYKHHSPNEAHLLNISKCQIFKIVYLTLRQFD